MTVDLGHPALLVVDVQNDFVHPDGRAGRGTSDMRPLLDAVGGINRLIGAARRSSVPVTYVRTTHSPSVDNRAYRARYSVRAMSEDDLLCADGSWGAEFYPDLEPAAPGELVVTKHAYDGFAVDELPAHLRKLGVDTIVVTGVVTELCVMGTVAGGFEHGFHVVVPPEGTGSLNPAAADAALRLVAGFYGTVATIDEVIAAFEALPSAVARTTTAS